MKLLKKQTFKLLQVFTNQQFLFLTFVGNSSLLLCTFGVYFFEKDINPNIHSYFDVLWWGVATITTVGYGDVVPVTTGGRILGIILIYTGTVMFVSFMGLILAILMKGEVEREILPLEDEVRKEGLEQQKIEKSIDEILERLDRIEKREK